MKQLKVICDNYDNNTGLIQVNFNQEIIIEPQSEIAMDKFSMLVTNGLTDNFEVPTQTVYIDTNTLDVNSLPRQAIVPAKTYVNMGQLMNQLNVSFNSVLDSDLLASANINAASTKDNGLFFKSWIDDLTSRVTIGFGSSGIDYSNDNYNLPNMSYFPKGSSAPNSPAVLHATATGAYSLTTSLPIVSGGVDCRFRLSDITVGNTGVNDYSYGIFLNEVLTYGIQKVGSQFYTIDNTIAIPFTPDTIFINQPDYIHQFCMKQGILTYCINTTGGSPARIAQFDFTGFDFNQSYYFGIQGDYTSVDEDSHPVSWLNLGIIYQSNITSDTFGVHWDFTSFKSPQYLTLFDLGLEAGALPPNRIVEFDFTQATVLQSGLGFISTIFDLGSTVGVTTASYVAEDAYGFNDYYDLMLMCPSIQIESYTATSDRKFGGRVNALCYFQPLPVNGATSTIYVYDNKELVFLTMSNRERINMSSFQFRVAYADDPNGRNFVKCDSMSFNLYIKEKATL